MRDLPLLRVGLGLLAVIALIALAATLGDRRANRSRPAPTSPAAGAAAGEPLPDVAAHWRELGPTLVFLDSATAIREPERRQEALKAAEDLLERAEERAPGAGELQGSPRREYREALERLRDAVDAAEEVTASPEALREVAEARARLETVATGLGGARTRS